MRAIIFYLAMLFVPIAVNAQLLSTANKNGANNEDEFACHGTGTKQTLVWMLVKDIEKNYGEETMRDVLDRMNPNFDLILMKGRNQETGALSCSAQLVISMEQINSKNVNDRSANAILANALLKTAGHPFEEENLINPSGFGDGTAYWDDIRYTIQLTSDGADHVVLIQNGQGYKDWFSSIVKYGGLEVTNEEAQLAADREAGREQMEQESKAPTITQPVTAIPKPSFDCAKAASTNEKLICSDAELAALDNELDGVYKQAKAKAADPAAFKQITVDAWRMREARCQDKACLVQWYTERKNALSML